MRVTIKSIQSISQNRMKSIVTPEELKRQLSIEPKVYWTKKSLCAYLEETTQLELFGNKNFFK